MADPAKASRTVTVACNIPNGYVLRLHAPGKRQEPVLGGGMREVDEYREIGRAILKGPAVPQRHDPNFVQPILDRNGYALTSGVDAELWEGWLAHNKNSDCVVNGCIYAVSDPDKAQKGDPAHRDKKSGLEPIAADGDPRMPRSRPGVTASPGTRAA